MLVVTSSTRTGSSLAEMGQSIPESGLFMGGEVESGLGTKLGMEWGLLSLLGLGACADAELG